MKECFPQLHKGSRVRLVLYWGLYRRPKREHAALKAAAINSQKDVKARQGVQTMSEVLEKSYEQEVYERGLLHGEARGEARGKAAGMRMTLEKLLRQRFGPVSEAVQQRLAVADAARLEAILDRLVSDSPPASPEDLPW